MTSPYNLRLLLLLGENGPREILVYGGVAHFKGVRRKGEVAKSESP